MTDLELECLAKLAEQDPSAAVEGLIAEATRAREEARLWRDLARADLDLFGAVLGIHELNANGSVSTIASASERVRIACDALKAAGYNPGFTRAAGTRS